MFRGSPAIRGYVSRAREVRTQPYWHHRQITTAAETTFFNTVEALARDGNLQVASQFPAPRQFLVKGISVYLTSVAGATAVADVAILANACYIFTIADKEYLRVLGWMAPGGGGLQDIGATAATQVMVRNGEAQAYNYFRLNPSVLIPQQQNFKVVLTSISGAPTAAVEVTVTLWGTEERAVQ